MTQVAKSKLEDLAQSNSIFGDVDSWVLTSYNMNEAVQHERSSVTLLTYFEQDRANYFVSAHLPGPDIGETRE